MRLQVLCAVLCLVVIKCTANPIFTITVPEEARSLTNVEKQGSIQEEARGVFKKSEETDGKTEAKPEENKVVVAESALDETVAEVKEEKRPKQKIKVTGRQSSDDDEDDDDDDDDDLGLGDDDDDDDDDDDSDTASDDDDDEEGDYFERLFDDILGDDDDDDDDDDDVSPSTGSQPVVEAQPAPEVIPEVNPSEELDAAEQAAGEAEIATDGTEIEQTENDALIDKDPTNDNAASVYTPVQQPIIVDPVPADDPVEEDDDDDDDDDGDDLGDLTGDDDDDDDDDDDETSDDDDDDDDETDLEDVIDARKSRESKQLKHSKKAKKSRKHHSHHKASSKKVR